MKSGGKSPHSKLDLPKINKSAFHVGVQQFHLNLMAHVEPLDALNQFSFHGGWKTSGAGLFLAAGTALPSIGPLDNHLEKFWRLLTTNKESSTLSIFIGGLPSLSNATCTTLTKKRTDPWPVQLASHLVGYFFSPWSALSARPVFAASYSPTYSGPGNGDWNTGRIGPVAQCRQTTVQVTPSASRFRTARTSISIHPAQRPSTT